MSVIENAPTVLVRIRQMIESGTMQSDGRLPTERELCSQLGTGRRAVRMALEVLEEEGLIWRRQGKGTFVGPPPDPTGILAADIVTSDDPMAVMEARLALEPELAALCARRAAPEDIDRMRRLHSHIGLMPSAEAAEVWDGALHLMIARVAGNPLLLTAFQLIDEVRQREDWQVIRDRARTPERLGDYAAQHTALIDAIASGDAEAARLRMREHLQSLSENLARALAGRDE